jgi:hypothetical protein
MCVGSPSINLPKPPAPSKPVEALQQVNADTAAARDNTNRRLAARLSLMRTQATSPLGLTTQASVTSKKLLGE